MRFTLFAVAIVAALAPATEAVSLNQIDTMFAQSSSQPALQKSGGEAEPDQEEMPQALQKSR